MKRNTALLISLLMIVHFIFGAYMVNAYSDYDSDIDRFPYILLKVNHPTDSVFFNTDDCRIFTFYSAYTNLYDRLTEHMYYADVSKNNYFYQKELPDYRKEVKKAIHPHFHGSKYKEGSLIV